MLRARATAHCYAVARHRGAPLPARVCVDPPGPGWSSHSSVHQCDTIRNFSFARDALTHFSFGAGDAWRSTCQHAAVQPLYSIERRQDCPLLPRREIREVFAGKHETAIDGAEVVVMQTPGVVAPMAEAAERRWIVPP